MPIFVMLKANNIGTKNMINTESIMNIKLLLFLYVSHLFNFKSLAQHVKKDRMHD